MAAFDKNAFDNLIGGDKELFVELLELFSTDYPLIMTALDVALERADFKQVEILAHRLRGMVRNFFAAHLAGLAEEIEDGAREGQLAEAPAKAAALLEGLKGLEKELAQHLKKFN